MGAKERRLFTKRRRGSSLGADADRLIVELETKFDLIRLRRHRAAIEREEARLAREVGFLRNGPSPSTGTPELRYGDLSNAGWRRRWWRMLVIKINVLWLESRRRRLVEEQRWLLLMEEDIRFGMRVTGMRFPKDPDA